MPHSLNQSLPNAVTKSKIADANTVAYWNNWLYTWEIQTALHTAIHTAGSEISAGNSQ